MEILRDNEAKFFDRFILSALKWRYDSNDEEGCFNFKSDDSRGLKNVTTHGSSNKDCKLDIELIGSQFYKSLHNCNYEEKVQFFSGDIDKSF